MGGGIVPETGCIINDMEILYAVIGFAIGIEVGRYQKDGTYNWKKAALVAAVAAVVAVVVAFVIR